MKCSVKNCRNTDKNSKCCFFRYPTNNERAKQWVIACNRQDLLPVTRSLHGGHRVCSQHFEDRMFLNDLKNRLFPHAKPTLNLPENLENDQNIGNASLILPEVADPESQVASNPFECVSIETSKSQSPAMENVQTKKRSNDAATTLMRFNRESQFPTLNQRIVILKPVEGISSPQFSIGNRKIVVLKPPFQQRLLFPQVSPPAKQNRDKIVQTTDDLSAHSPMKLKLQKENAKLKKEIAALQEKVGELANISKDQFVQCCEQFLPAQTALFVKEQVLIHNRKTQGRRFSTEFKQHCLNIYREDPKAYRALSSMFLLPSRGTLKRMTSEVIGESREEEEKFHCFKIELDENVFDPLGEEK